MTKNPFASKTSRKPKSLGTTRPLIANDAAAIQLRAVQKKQFDFRDVDLNVRNQTTKSVFTRSFEHFAEKYPHHELLVKQLLRGAYLDVGVRRVSYQVHQDAYNAIEEFVEFLNDNKQPHNKKVTLIADVDFQITRNLVAYYLQKYPGRTVNRKRYSRLRTAIDELKSRYSDDPSIGDNIAWAQTPSNNEVPTESYPNHIFNQLVEASLKDIQFIKNVMVSYEKNSAAEMTELAEIKSISKDGVINKLQREDSNDLCSKWVRATAPFWPLRMSFVDSNRFFSNNEQVNLPKLDHARFVFRALATMRFPYVVKNFESGADCYVSLETGKLAYISQFFFTVETIVPFILYVQLNTGWNMEAVLSLSDDLESHVAEDLIDPEYAVIYGSKGKTESALPCRSSKSNPYSVYNVLRFVQSCILKHQASPHYKNGFLWQAVLPKNLWPKFGRIISAINQSSYKNASNRFLKRHGIKPDTQAKKTSIDSRRIRTTWETRRREQGLPIEQVSVMMGHSETVTTEVNYDSDTGSRRVLNDRLRPLQNRWQEEFTDYHARLVTTTSLAELRDAIGDASRRAVVAHVANQLGLSNPDQIIHLLSPAGQTYIVACLNSKAPTWPDAERFVPADSDCAYFNRCCMCKQAVVFKEALPFMVRRVQDLLELKSRIQAIEWAVNYSDEVNEWEAILARWTPSSDVDEARIMALGQEYALPLTMRGPA